MGRFETDGSWMDRGDERMDMMPHGCPCTLVTCFSAFLSLITRVASRCCLCFEWSTCGISVVRSDLSDDSDRCFRHYAGRHGQLEMQQEGRSGMLQHSCCIQGILC
ncbi:hypothetical protein OBBRIDRAFT_30603 [Obba rivulosa]|uniref:Uncharacterized protein n=1 Tax=Obba rivulosa TaxID=1052685 RepID=A0A8E2AS14_9APHY|nr:hypothetical protein OBBRIDRAFT_30603 [Obba rivulosa]